MEEFQGKLESIPPNKLINKNESDDFDNFFLVFGLIFNDLKDILLFFDLFNKIYKHPKLDGKEPASVHLGQWGGLYNHLNRLILGFLSEFMVFLDKNKEVINDYKFKLLVKKLPSNVKNNWRDITDVLEEKVSNNFLSDIARIRSNVVFHYDQSLTELRSGFIKKFFNPLNKNEYSKKAFYSIGDNAENTRFYYCDGAVEEYFKEHMGYYTDNSHFVEGQELIKKASVAIKFLMESYIKGKD